MKAWVLHDIGDIRFEDVDMPKIGDNEVLVAVKAAGICGSDIPRIYETGAHNMPIIPGHEFSGQVVDTGKNVDKKWLDKRVGVFPLIPCGKCDLCKRKLYEMCRNYNYLGSRCNGGFAEYCAVPEWNLIELPDNVTYEQAAMLEPMSVAVHAIRRANIKPSDTVAIQGLGTIGLLVIMFLKEMGIKNILAIGNKDFQKDAVTEIGLAEEDFCNSKNTAVSGFIKNKTTDGVDVYFECVGKNETINAAVDNVMAGTKINRPNIAPSNCFLCSWVLPSLNDAPKIISATGVVAAEICPIGFKIGFGTSTPKIRSVAPVIAPKIIGFLKMPFKIGKSANFPPRNVSSAKTARTL